MPIENNRLVSRFNTAARRAPACPDGGASSRRAGTPAETAAPPPGAAPPAGAAFDVAEIVEDAGRRLAKGATATKVAAAQAERAARRQRAIQEDAAMVAEAKAAQQAMREILKTVEADRARVQRPAKQNPKPRPNAARQPPVQHRFKAGQSGNPAGRPKGSRNKVVRGALARMVLMEAERAAPGRDGVSAHQAVVRTLYDRAAEGDVRAAALILPMAAEAEGVVADLDEAAEAREAEAAAAQQACETAAAAASRRSAAVAEEAAFAARLAAENPKVYRHARELMAPKWGVPSRLSFSEAVARARVQVAIGQHPGADFDPHLAAAALAKAAAVSAEPDADGDEDEGDA